MELFFLMMVVGLLITLVHGFMEAVNQKSKPVSAIAPKICPPHRWHYADDGRMQCLICNNKPFEGSLGEP